MLEDEFDELLGLGRHAFGVLEVAMINWQLIVIQIEQGHFAAGGLGRVDGLGQQLSIKRLPARAAGEGEDSRIGAHGASIVTLSRSSTHRFEEPGVALRVSAGTKCILKRIRSRRSRGGLHSNNYPKAASSRSSSARFACCSASCFFAP